MKLISYMGAEGDCIVIEQPTDIYPLLDWCHSRMIENQDLAKGEVNIQKWEKAITFLSGLMDKTEGAGFGSQEDIDNISY